MASPGTAVADDVPARFDVSINGYGYMFLQSLEQSLPFRTQRALYSSSQTFTERQNVGAAYGDNTQDFFLVLSQNDWSLGENQRYFRVSDADRIRRYWQGTNLDPISTPGQVSLRKQVTSPSFGETALTCAARTGTIYAAGSTTLSSVSVLGVVSSLGAHGLGAAPSKFGLCVDADFAGSAFLSTSSTGTVGVRRYNGSYSTFSATGVDSMVVLNNTLYGFQESTGQLLSFDTGGATTTVYTWKDATGTAVTNTKAQYTRLRTIGGKLLLLRPQGEHRRGELWQYDGTSTSMLTDLPGEFNAKDIDVGNGIVYISGYYGRDFGALPAVLYYVNGTLGELWRANTVNTTNSIWPSLAAFGPGLVFTDDSVGNLMQYSVALGGVHSVGSYTATNGVTDITPILAASSLALLHTRESVTGTFFPSSSLASSGTLVSSLFDFDNSLPKIFRGIKVDWVAQNSSDTAPSSAASVTIAYVLDNLSNGYANLTTNAVSGTEYTLPAGTSGQAIGYRLTLTKASSVSGPAIQRVYIRAAPLLQTFKRREYVLDLSGIDAGPDTVRLADDTPHPLTGFAQAANLQTAIASATPITVIDGFGSYSALCEPGECEIIRTREGNENRTEPGAYVAKIVLREV